MSGRSGRWRWRISSTDSSTGTRSSRGQGSRRRSSRAGSCGSRRRVRLGRPYTVLVATPAGAARAPVLWASAGRADQRVHSGGGGGKAADVGHEVAVYRAACAAQARIEAEGGRSRPDPDRCRTQGAGRPTGRASSSDDGPGGGRGGAATRRGGAKPAGRARHGALSGRTDRVRHRGGLGRRGRAGWPQPARPQRRREYEVFEL